MISFRTFLIAVRAKMLRFVVVCLCFDVLMVAVRAKIFRFVVVFVRIFCSPELAHNSIDFRKLTLLIFTREYEFS